MNKIKCIDSFTLKIIAIIFMLCDHLWATIVPGNDWLTCLGRIAFPIFAFQIAEGFKHTKNFNKYLLRMFIFALISEIPFNLMMGGTIIYPFHQNVLFSFCISLIFLNIMEKAKQKSKKKYIITSILSTIFGFLIGTITMVDYFGFGILTVFVFYWFKDLKHGRIFEILGMIIINVYLLQGQDISINLFKHTFYFPQQAFALFSLLPIFLYNGKKGIQNKFTKYLFYVFYPLHMLILSLLSL